jgi:hypothetical protein
MRNKRIILTITILAVAIGATALWTTSRASNIAFAAERQLNFASVGIAAGQTARLNVSNLGAETLTAQFFVFDNQGVNHLPLVEYQIEPEHSASVDLPAEAANLIEGRQQLRGMINVQSPAGRVPDDSVMASLEIFDARTGRTSLALNFAPTSRTHNYFTNNGGGVVRFAQ